MRPLVLGSRPRAGTGVVVVVLPFRFLDVVVQVGGRILLEHGVVYLFELKHVEQQRHDIQQPESAHEAVLDAVPESGHRVDNRDHMPAHEDDKNAQKPHGHSDQ